MEERADGPSLGELAEDWLNIRRLRGSVTSHAGRHSDLLRLAWALRSDDPTAERQIGVGVRAAFGPLTPDVLTPEAVTSALVALSATHRRSTLLRTLSTTRVWCRWAGAAGPSALEPVR